MTRGASSHGRGWERDNTDVGGERCGDEHVRKEIEVGLLVFLSGAM